MTKTPQNRDLQPESRSAQALGWEDPNGGLAPAVQPATTYLRQSGDNTPGYSYSRADNPSYAQCEALLANLENGEAGLLFASGMAAAVNLFQALPQGAKVLANDVMYWGVRHWLNQTGSRQGLSVHYFPSGDIDALSAVSEEIKPDLIWIETPSNPMWQVIDIAAAAEIARRDGAYLAADNTVATPVLTRPIDLGADFVMHSATKYLNGHSDCIAGALIAARDSDIWEAVREQRTYGGAVLGPFEAWLLLRGMRTLFLRVRQASETAFKIAQHFQNHPQVSEVLYPGLEGFPNHHVAARQMQGGYSGMLSIRVKEGEAAAARTADRTTLWKQATSLGGVESLIEHRAPVEGPGSPVPRDLLRLSTGIEAASDLIEDLEMALT